MQSVRHIDCKHNPESKEQEAVCPLCQSMIDYQPQRGFQPHLRVEEHERAMALFGGPSGTSKRRWNTLSANVEHSEHVQWARLEQEKDPIATYPSSVEDFETLVEAIERGDNLSPVQESMLRDGIGFIDGSMLRYMDSMWSLNGVPLHGLSLAIVFSLLGRYDARKGWDIPALLLGISSVNPNLGGHHPLMQRHPRGQRELRSHYRPLASMLTWLSNRLKVDRTLSMESAECVPMMAWSHDIQTRMFEQQPGNLEGMFQNALGNHPPGLFEAYDTPWMRGWRALESAQNRADTQKWAMDINRKNARIRVRTPSGKLRLIQVPTNPVIWAFLISITLSPLNSEAGRLLLGLQHNWSVAYAAPHQPTAPLVRSLEFYHQIMNGLDSKIFVQHAKALVVGRLGHLYEIAVESGQHGAPYTIQHLVDIDPNAKHPICIHSGRIAETVPLGDTIGGVLLSMVNDVEASRDIGSLQELLQHEPPFGFPRQNIPLAWLDALGIDDMGPQHRHAARDFQWYWERRELEQERRPGRGLHELLMRNRHHRRRSRYSQRWNARYHAAFDRDGTFPLDEVVAAWRNTVHPYIPGSSGLRERGEFFGGVHEGYFRRRYHHMMNHRRFDDVHDEGDVRDGERRWCEVFARAWEVLVHQPLGSIVRIPNEDGMPLSFEHAALQITVRSPLERNFLARISRVLGYVKDDEQGHDSIFVRRDHPRPNARLQLTDLLRDTQDRQRVRGAPPRWWNYVDVVTPPRNVPHLRWQLQIDYTDDRRPRADGDARRALNFNGLGDLFG